MPPEVGDPQPDTATLADTGRLTSLLDQLGRLGRTERPLGVWVTEFGYETNPPDPTQPVTAGEQASWLPQAEAIALANPRVRSWSQFLLRDLGPQPGRTEHQRWGDFQTGLELPDGRSKPAMRSFAYPLVALRASPGVAGIWGRLRPGFGPRPVRVTAGGAPLRTLTTGPDGSFAFTAPAGPGTTFALQVREAKRWTPVGRPVRLP